MNINAVFHGAASASAALPPSPFLVIDETKKELGLRATNILAQSLARVLERGMPEMQLGFQRALEDVERTFADRLECAKRALQPPTQIAITEEKVEELRADFTEQINAAFKEKESQVVEPLRAYVTELEVQLEAAKDLAAKYKRVASERRGAASKKRKGDDDGLARVRAEKAKLVKVVKRQRRTIDMLNKKIDGLSFSQELSSLFLSGGEEEGGAREGEEEEREM